MKKYVLNIERLYAGQTANAMVLNQVDEEPPVLLPSIPRGTRNWNAWIQKFNEIHDFNPGTVNSLDELNEKIIDFNLNLQTQFKEKGHPELYMMDDTQTLKPDESTVSFDKIYLHCLDGKAESEKDDGKGNSIQVEVNSSQMNVLFPYKKVTSKSIYSTQLKVHSYLEIDDLLERSRGITLQGKVTSENCLQGVVQVGNNLYVMSPNIDIDSSNTRIHGNGITMVNAYYDRPYYFPHSMTLFQPSQDVYNGPNLAKGDPLNFREFIEWYELHSRKTVVSLDDAYGANVSTFTCLGPGSYELFLGTYSPTDIIVSDEDGNNEIDIPLTPETYRKLRNDESPGDFFSGGKYVFDNSKFDHVGSDGEWHFGHVGLMFNMYDTFITGTDRVLKMHIPQNKDFNKLMFSFEWEVRKDSGLAGDFEATVYVGEEMVFEVDKPSGNEYVKDINDTAITDHDLTITVRIHYNVDFGRRSTEREYRDMLRRSGVILKNIRVENGVYDESSNLTFGSYISEDGIDEEERKRRIDQFMYVSQYKRDMAYQTVLESSIKNMTTAGLVYANNYSSGDVYGDMFVTKSVLDPRYDMNIGLEEWDETDMKWKSDNTGLPDGELEQHQFTKMLHSEARDYIGLGECSNQLSLLYRPIDVAIGYSENDDRIYTRRTGHRQDDKLKYQMVEVVKNINKFESSIKHKSNVFSVVVENSNLAPDNSDSRDETWEKYKEQLRNSVTQFVRDTCEGIVPVHTQLFDVQFT